MKSFQERFPLEQRKSESSRIMQRYSDRVPVIVEIAKGSHLPTLDKSKYLVPKDLTVSQFLFVIRKRIRLAPEKAIFLFINNILPPTAALMSAVYEEHKASDNFLYCQCAGENCYGDGSL